MEPTSNGTSKQEKKLDIPGDEKKENLKENPNQASSLQPKPNMFRAVRTFERDLARVMKEKKGSVIGIAIREQRERENNVEKVEDTPRKKMLLIFFSALAIAGGLAFIGYFFINSNGKDETIGTIKINSLITAESNKEISVDGFSQIKLIKTVVLELASTNLRLDTVLNLYFTETVAGAKQKISTERFFSLLGGRIPPVLLRSLGDNFMFGIHVFNGNQPFIVLKTDFYENAFLGLLKWEGNMVSDILPIFGVRFNDENRYLIDKQFSDGTLKNIDVRKLIDNKGKIILIYAIPNKETIIIATGEDTLSEVVNRLNAPKKITQ
ncbi:MAG: hypothetical protein AAB756_00570 [Patescibacteria group bacterium]